MGASKWTSKVAYQPDITAALQQARLEAYEAGDFYRDAPDPIKQGLSEREFLVAVFGEEASDELDEDYPGYEEARLEWRAAQVEVTGPNSLLESQPFSGTHSIIDIPDVADQPRVGAVAPLPDADLERWFGTRTPDARAVELALSQGLSGFDRWCGAYVIAYSDCQPELIYFFGWSGD